MLENLQGRSFLWSGLELVIPENLQRRSFLGWAWEAYSESNGGHYC
jgi:hypothetical protein